MKSIKISVCFLLILSMTAAGCSKIKTEKETESSKEIVTYSSEADLDTGSEATDETVQLESETSETEESSETETETEEETTAEVKKDLMKFFGHGMDPDVCETNRKTLAQEGSMLFDVLSDKVFTASQVLQMVESFTMPEKPYMNGAEATDSLRKEISAYRNLDALIKAGDEKISLRYGILVDNADVRNFPTDVKTSDSNDLFSFDYFQESVLPAASGVIVLHETSDGLWFFVQGENYYGWVRSEHVGLCTLSAFSNYLTTDNFLVVIVSRANTDYGAYRLGTILPYTKKVNDEYMVKIPRRNADGSFFYDILPLPDDGSYHEGFLERDLSLLSALAESLIGVPYGWGDSGNYYDCSSTVGLLYRCFGFYLPRNTSAMKYFGGSVIDLSEMTDEEKLSIISEHPGAILIMPGHAMYYAGDVSAKSEDGSEEKKHRVIHNTTGYCTTAKADTFISCNCVMDSFLEDLFRKNGESFLSRLTVMLLFEENTADTAQ